MVDAIGSKGTVDLSLLANDLTLMCLLRPICHHWRHSLG